MDLNGTSLDFHSFATKAEWQAAVDVFVLNAVQQLLAKHASIRVLLSGGSTPKGTYEHLSKATIPFGRVDLFQADERYVSPDSPDLNAIMLRQSLHTDSLQYRAVNFFDTKLSQSEAVQKYEQLLQNLPTPLFHFTILGVGPDGHTASLFPHVPALHADSLVATSETEVFAGKNRLTLTPSALEQSNQILILATGPEKKGILDRFKANTETIDTLPILCVRNHPSVTVMYCEE